MGIPSITLGLDCPCGLRLLDGQTIVFAIFSDRNDQMGQVGRVF